MRFNAICTLVSREYATDDEGVNVPDDNRTIVFCNERTVGASTWQFYHEAGISDVAEIQLRTGEYAGQRDVEYEGKPYSVEQVITEGDFTRLVLRKQGSDTLDRGEST